MDSLFDYFLGESRRHIHDEQLLALTDGELSMAETRRVQKHLERCWNCRTRHERLQGVIHGFVDYSNEVVAPYLPPPPHGRDRFLRALDAELSPKSRTSWFLPLKTLRAFSESAMNPIVMTVIVVLVASTVLAVVWYRAAKHGPATEQLLAEAIRSEQAAKQHDGVAYQKVEIRAPHRILERSIYRDLAGHRQPVPAKLSATESSARSRLASGGVSWDDPLSPRDYQSWRSHVHVIGNDVKRTAPGEWTLVTRTDDSTVRQASLTIRESDFHPISRQIVFRDAETISIAELNFDVLPWSAVNEAMFEPLDRVVNPPGSATDIRASSRDPLPTHAELEGAELQAQLALLKVHTDSGEDVRVEPGRSAVRVRGIVDTDSRKREIEEGLSGIALVKPELQSFEQIERMRNSTQPGGSVQVRETQLQPSPLETFLTTKSVPAEQAVLLSRTLTQSSLAIAREAQAMAALDARYGEGGQGLNDENRRLLGSLKEQHLSILHQALASEESALAPYAEEQDFKNAVTPKSLSSLAIDNQKLCAELVAGSGDNSRSGDAILRDLIRVSSQIRNTVHPIPPSSRR